MGTGPHAGAAQDNLPLGFEVVPDMVSKALRTFPADTAPGPCGLWVQHVREAAPPGASVVMLEQLSAEVGLLLQRRACADVAPVMACASLVAVPKPNGGARPHGKMLRRLTSQT